MFALSYILLCLTVHAICIAVSDRLTRIFLITLFICHFYFCLGGFYYWITVKHGLFGGFYWDPDDLGRAYTVLTVSTAAVAVLVTAINRAQKTPPPRASSEDLDLPLTRRFVWLSAIGLLSCLFVAGFGRNAEGAKNSFTLIAYQFSDMLVPCAVFALAMGRRYRKIGIVLIALFVVYAVYVGFRYKLALVLVPILFWLLFGPMPAGRKALVVSVMSGCVVVLFSAMTLFRVKFGGIDLDRTAADAVDPLYSFFAEANIIFAMTAVMDRFVDFGNYYYLDPIRDAILELIPRILMPDRATGMYLIEMSYGFVTEQGMKSGTAYPFIGEFAIMGGYFGVAIGIVVYSIIYCVLHRLILLKGPNDSVRRMGLGLLAAIMGYYHFSRGYLPQANKAYLFVLLPFVFLMAQAMRNYMRRAAPDFVGQMQRLGSMNLAFPRQTRALAPLRRLR